MTMTPQLPPPPVPEALDLRHFKDMPLEVRRVRDSDIIGVGDAEVFRSNFSLWCGSWHQVPAGSVPDDDATLARMVGLGRDMKTWQRIKRGALHGFRQFSDGRWYHRVVCEKAVESWNKSAIFIWKRECDRLRKENADRAEARLPQLSKPPKPQKVTLRWPVETSCPTGRDADSGGNSGGQDEGGGPISDIRSDGNGREIPSEKPGREKKVKEGKGSKYSEPNGSGASLPAQPVIDLAAQLFGEGVTWLQAKTGKSNAACRQLIGRWRKDLRSDDAALISIIADAQRQGIEHPESWVAKAIQTRGGGQSGVSHADQFDLIADAHDRAMTAPLFDIEGEWQEVPDGP